VAGAADPVAAVLEAHARGRLLALRTSGTTGAARSVVRTTESWFGSLDTGSEVWVPGPLSATMNLFAAVHARVVGAAVTPEPRAASHAVLTPAALARALAQQVPLDGVHLVVAGDRLGRPLQEAALGAGADRVSHYYGAAELSFVAWGSHAEDLTAFPGVEVDTSDGRVWVRSPYVFRRYDGPAGPLVRRPDGFVTVGDRGVLERGRLRVLGRGHDTVVTGGATVHVGDVETALEEATGVRPVVVGAPHPDLGQVVCGVVDDPQHLARLRQAARDVLAGAGRPRRWFVVPDPPVTGAAKVDRVALVAQLARLREADDALRRTVDPP
jgi:long-chain acyl-CoA synthetase